MNNAIRKFKNGEFGVNCISEFEVDNFLKICHRNGLQWVSGDSLLELNYWRIHKDKTCYICSHGAVSYGSVERCTSPVISYNEFISKYKSPTIEFIEPIEPSPSSSYTLTRDELERAIESMRVYTATMQGTSSGYYDMDSDYTTIPNFTTSHIEGLRYVRPYWWDSSDE